MFILNIFVAFTFAIIQCASLNSFPYRTIVKRSSQSDRAESYHSRHPPLEENYAPISIPVSIIYDESQANAKMLTTEKTITTYHPRYSTTQSPAILTEELNPSTTVSTPTRKNSVYSVVKQSEPKQSRAELTKELQIPVVVVYDPITDKNIKRNIVTESPQSKVTAIGRQRGRRLKPLRINDSLVSSTAYPKEEPDTTTEAIRSFATRQYVPSRTRRTTTKVIIEETTQALYTSINDITTASSSTESSQTSQDINVEFSNKSTQQDTSKETVQEGVITKTESSIKENSQSSISRIIQSITPTTATHEQSTRSTSRLRKPNNEMKTGKPNETIVSTTFGTPKRTRDPVVPIIESKNYVFAQSGVFHYSYEGGDGTKNYEDGKLKSFDDEATGEAVSGGFSYKDNDGKDISLTYTADENGYRPVGAHLPTPPPIPPAIARALKYLATKTTESDEVTESISKVTQ